MTLPGSRFHSDDWVYVRYAVPGKHGEPVAPTAFHLETGTLEGAAAIAAVLDRAPLAGRYDGYRLTGDRISGDIADLDLSAPLQAYAYTSEKVFYLRTNLVESFPLAARGLMDAPLENVPNVSKELVDRERSILLAAAEALDGATGFIREETIHELARLIAFDNARAMLDAAAVFGQDRVVANPLDPVRLGAVFLLERDFKERWVLQPSNQDHFLGNLFVGTTPTGTRETAYNAYRAVDDAAERAVIDAWPAEQHFPEGLFAHIRRTANVPLTLVAEATLFTALHSATRCFSLNTILQSDDAVNTRAEAVARTLKVIVEAAQGRIKRPLSLDDYAAAIS